MADADIHNVLGGFIYFWSTSKERAEAVAQAQTPPGKVVEDNGAYKVVCHTPYEDEQPADAVQTPTSQR